MSMGPCPKCNRHVSLSERACPHCDAEFGISRRDLGILAAAAATLAVVSDAAAEPWTQAAEYGVPRPQPVPVGRTPMDVVYSGWMADAGLFNPANAWAGHKPGTIITYTSANTPGPIQLSATLSLEKVADAAVSIKVVAVGQNAEERAFGRTAGVPKDAKITEETKETLEIDGTKYDCAAKTYEMPGRTFKVWECKDAPLGVAKVTCGEEKTTLVKAKESLKNKSGDHECSVWETVVGETTQKTWRSAKVPGLVVRVVETVKGSAAITIDLNSITEGK